MPTGTFPLGKQLRAHNEGTYHVFRDPASLPSLVLKKAKTGPLPDGMQWCYWRPLKGELPAHIGLSLPKVCEATEEMMRTDVVRDDMARILRAGRG